MIIKNRIKNLPFVSFFRALFSKIIISLGVFSLLTIIFVLFYYFSSGMHARFNPSLVIKEVNTNILNKYLGFNIYEIDDYFLNRIYKLKYTFVENELENIKINIDQPNLYNLELQRQNKINQEKNKVNVYSKATLSLNENNYRIKLRLKGDRAIHWHDKESSSYKIDVRGGDTIWGMEEFSVQKPIARNYIYEFIFHKMLNFSDLISLKYFFINLSMNDTKQGIYAVEEGFSKELIERNKKRNGPIFGLEEDRGTTYPYVRHDLYSSQYWISNYPDLTSAAISKLNLLRDNEIELNEIFDLEKWATYFAIIDLTSSHHGSISKSVKLFYNPVSSKFEPIGFDAHYQPGLFENFMIIDFLDLDNINCSYICYDREWYFKFLKKKNGSLNKKFINIYLKKLNELSSENYINSFKEKYSEEIQYFNSQLLSEQSKTDKMFYKGLGDYIFDNNYLINKSKYINSRLKQISQIGNLEANLKQGKIYFHNSNKFFFKKIIEDCKEEKNFYYLIKDASLEYNDTCKYNIGIDDILIQKNIYLSKDKNFILKFENFSKIYDFDVSKKKYILENDIFIEKNIILPKNKTLIVNEGVKILFKDDVIFLSNGSIIFNGSTNKPILVEGINNHGSIILNNNKFSINNVKFNNLSLPKQKSKILYGGINIINSNVDIRDSEVSNSNSEDAINIISSNTNIDSFKISDTLADGLDIDFGKLVFKNIECERINNDCLDVSGAEVNGETLYARDISDKGLSFGESSNGIISDLIFFKNNLAVAVKDGSKLKLSEYVLEENNYDFAVFNKKNEYGQSTLNLDDDFDFKNFNILVGEDNNLITNKNFRVDKVTNKYINDLFYNNIETN